MLQLELGMLTLEFLLQVEMLLQLDGAQDRFDLGRGMVRWDLALLLVGPDDVSHRVDLIGLGHVRLVRRLEVIFHFVRPGELLVAHWTGEDFSLGTFMVQEGMSLEAVFVLEGLLYVFLGTFHTLVDSVADTSVTEEIQPTNGHLGQSFGLIVRSEILPPGTTPRRLSGRRQMTVVPIWIFKRVLRK